MRTACSLPYRGGEFCPGESPWNEIPLNRDALPHRRNMGPGRQTRSDIIQRPPPPVNRMTHTNKNITMPQTSFVGGNKAIIDTDYLKAKHATRLPWHREFGFSLFQTGYKHRETLLKNLMVM